MTVWVSQSSPVQSTDPVNKEGPQSVTIIMFSTWSGTDLHKFADHSNSSQLC